jgi:hypothetical protein
MFMFKFSSDCSALHLLRSFFDAPTGRVCSKLYDAWLFLTRFMLQKLSKDAEESVARREGKGNAALHSKKEATISDAEMAERRAFCSLLVFIYNLSIFLRS